MKHVILFGLICWLGVVQVAHAAIRVAPLDEYFGKQKLSPLGIENTIHDTNLRVRYDPLHADRYYAALAGAEDALDDWARKYPDDPWLPGRAYFMSQVFSEMHTSSGDAAAQACRDLLFTRFATSHWAKLAKAGATALVARDKT